MKTLTFLKLGGALLTDKAKPLTPRPSTIARLAKSIAEVNPQISGQLIIGHGQGSFGHVLVDKHQLRKGLVDQGGEGSIAGLSEALYGIQILHDLVHRSFLDADVPVISFPTHSWGVSTGTKSKSIYSDIIDQALDLGMTPLVSGDIVFDTNQGCIVWSTERIFIELIVHYQKTSPDTKLRVIFVTDVPGVLDSDGQVIPEISSSSYQSITQHLSDSKHIDVTGGMKKKVETGLALAEKGVEVVICGEEALEINLSEAKNHNFIGTVVSK